jgi:hypothetical protein
MASPFSEPSSSNIYICCSFFLSEFERTLIFNLSALHFRLLTLCFFCYQPTYYSHTCIVLHELACLPTKPDHYSVFAPTTPLFQHNQFPNFLSSLKFKIKSFSHFSYFFLSNNPPNPSSFRPVLQPASSVSYQNTYPRHLKADSSISR